MTTAVIHARPAPAATLSRPPSSAPIIVSSKNCKTMVPRLAPIARLMPISDRRSATLAREALVMVKPPTRNDTTAVNSSSAPTIEPSSRDWSWLPGSCRRKFCTSKWRVRKTADITVRARWTRACCTSPGWPGGSRAR